MHLKCHRRFKDGKEHRYWSIVESRRCAGGRVVPRHVLYLGEINDSQKESWLRCIEAGSEWRLHREWFERSAMADLLCADYALAAKDTLYRGLDRLCEHKDQLFHFLQQRWQDLFGLSFDVLLYDLTSTYFESEPPF